MPMRPWASCTVATPAAARPSIVSRPARSMFWMTTPMGSVSLLHRRRAVRVEGLDRLEPPGLALLALRLGPDDRLPVGGEDQSRTGIGELDAVAGGLPHIEEERALDGLLVRPGFDGHRSEGRREGK